ncbi:TcaA NTF2-like domain-containing protein [Virgibacillus kimchii]
MNYCTHCGSPLEKNYTFCTSCGAQLKSNRAAQDKRVLINPEPTSGESVKQASAEENSNVTVTQEQQNSPDPNHQKKVLSKRQKIVLGITAVFLLMLFGTHQFLSSYFDPGKDLEAMDQAILHSNPEEFLNFIQFDESALLDEVAYFQYIKDNEWPTVKEQLIQLMDDRRTNTSDFTPYVESIYGGNLLAVTQEPILFGLYHTYKLEAVPVKLMVDTNLENTEVTLGDMSIFVDALEPAELASLYAGSYSLEASAHNEFGTFTHEEDFEVRAGEEKNVSIEFPGSSYGVSSNMMDATLFIDGKDTGEVLGSIESLGPFPPDNNAVMHAEWERPDGEVFKSDDVTVNDVSWGSLPFQFDETAMMDEPDVASAETEEINMEDAEQVVLDFRANYETALNTKDFSLIESFLKEDSEVDEELRTYIGDLEDTAYQYNFISNEILDVEEISEDLIEVATEELFIFTNHVDEQIDYDREKVYTMVQEEDGYKITRIDYVETNRDY